MKLKRSRAVLTIGVIAAASLGAGGFVLDIGRPSANAEAQSMNAALVVRGMACVEQEKTTITGTAEGIVNGARQSISLELTQLSDVGTFAVRQQWPNQGDWVLTFVAKHPRMGQRGAIVRLNGGRVDWARVTRMDHAPSKQEVEASLNTRVVATR
jgi:hypothetical protein